MASVKLRGEDNLWEYIACRDIPAGGVFTREDYLSPAQVRAIRTLAQFEDPKQAAALLRVSQDGFKMMTAHLRRKTGTQNMPQLILWAVKHGIIHVDASANGSHADPSLTVAEGHATQAR
jgi:DNA-binding CsgD family transcriptional regulator